MTEKVENSRNEEIVEAIDRMITELSSLRCVCTNIERCLSNVDSKYHDGAGIDGIGMSQRAVNALMNAGVNTVGRLRRTDMNQLRGVKGIGGKTYAEIADYKYNILR